MYWYLFLAGGGWRLANRSLCTQINMSLSWSEFKKKFYHVKGEDCPLAPSDLPVSRWEVFDHDSKSGCEMYREELVSVVILTVCVYVYMFRSIGHLPTQLLLYCVHCKQPGSSTVIRRLLPRRDLLHGVIGSVSRFHLSLRNCLQTACQVSNIARKSGP